MAVSDAHKRASNKWNSSRDNIMVRPEKEEGAAIRAAAAASNLSVQAFILQTIREKMERQQAGTVEPPTEAEAQAGVVMVSPGGVHDENICSRFISQWGPDFQSALDASGQSAEEYIKQAVVERMKRETRPPTPDI